MVRIRRFKWGPVSAALLILLLFVQACSKQEESQAPKAVAASPEQQQQMKAFSRTADELYQHAAAGELKLAGSTLLELSGLAAGIKFDGLASLEGADVLTGTIAKAKRTLAQAKPSQNEAVHEAAKLMLAADVLTHPHQPLWLKYDEILSKDTLLMKESAAADNRKELLKEFAAMKEHYDTIRPSVWLSRDVEEGENLDSFLSYIGHQLDSQDFRSEQLPPVLDQWQNSLDEVFMKGGERTAYLPINQPDDPIRWSLTIGSLIIAVLSYSAWRMFQIDRSLVRAARRPDDE